jgi:carbamoyl-phosphate synthase large subunit
MKNLRILIGSCGGLTGVYLAKLLRQLKLPGYNKIELFGFDSNEYVPTKFFIDKFLVVRRASDKEVFLGDLITILNEYAIDIYIPVHSEECRVVSEYEDHIRKSSKAKFMLSPYRTFQELDNKANAYKSLSKLGIRVPKIFETEEQLETFPVAAKPQVGSGSKGFVKINSYDEYKQFKEKNPDALIVEFLTGEEYTVDAFFDNNGKLVTYNQRIRLKTMGGAAVITVNDFTIDVREYIERIAASHTIIGPANFQFFKTADGEIVFTDINLRFASGGLPLSVASGANIVELLLLELLGLDYDSSKYQSDKKKRIMYRYFEEIFEEI